MKKQDNPGSLPKKDRLPARGTVEYGDLMEALETEDWVNDVKERERKAAGLTKEGEALASKYLKRA